MSLLLPACMELKWAVDKVQGFVGSRYSHSGPSRGEARPGNPKEHQLGSGTTTTFSLQLPFPPPINLHFTCSLPVHPLMVFTGYFFLFFCFIFHLHPYQHQPIITADGKEVSISFWVTLLALPFIMSSSSTIPQPKTNIAQQIHLLNPNL